MTPSERVAWLTDALRDGLDPLHLVVDDESHLHAGHPGAAGGGGHFRALIVSAAFRGQAGQLPEAALPAFLPVALVPLRLKRPDAPQWLRQLVLLRAAWFGFPKL